MQTADDMQPDATYDRRRALKIEGEMAERVRAFDWSATPLGPRQGWSLSLKAVVHMMLASRFPMVMMWGPDLTILYNDAFRPSLSENGKHPGILGLPAREGWAEMWSTIGPLLAGVVRTGESLFLENLKTPLVRDGFEDHAYWTFSYSPLIEDDGTIGGVLSVCLETTQEVEHVEYFPELAR